MINENFTFTWSKSNQITRKNGILNAGITVWAGTCFLTERFLENMILIVLFLPEPVFNEANAK